MDITEPTLQELRDAPDINDEHDEERCDLSDIILLEARMDYPTRWGYSETSIFYRKSDNTYWSAKYDVESGDAGEHGFYSPYGFVLIAQVYPVEVKTIMYMKKDKPNE